MFNAPTLASPSLNAASPSLPGLSSCALTSHKARASLLYGPCLEKKITQCWLKLATHQLCTCSRAASQCCRKHNHASKAHFKCKTTDLKWPPYTPGRPYHSSLQTFFYSPRLDPANLDPIPSSCCASSLYFFSS